MSSTATAWPVEALLRTCAGRAGWGGLRWSQRTLPGDGEPWALVPHGKGCNTLPPSAPGLKELMGWGERCTEVQVSPKVSPHGHLLPAGVSSTPPTP